MINEHAIGRITDITEEGLAVIHAALPNLKHALDRHYDEVEIILPDARRITAKQRAKIYCLIGEISEFVNGEKKARSVEETKEIMKWDFCLKMMESQERKLFSLSNVDETTATNFISYLIDFIIENDVPMSVPLVSQCEDIGKYVYACLLARRCCICGKSADLHHVDAVGMGNDRDEIIHIGREALPLCREHHTELHSMGNSSFMTKYHIEPVKIDEKIAKKYKLNMRKREKGV